MTCRFYLRVFSFYLLFIYLPFICLHFSALILKYWLTYPLIFPWLYCLLISFLISLLILFWLFLPYLQNPLCEPLHVLMDHLSLWISLVPKYFQYPYLIFFVLCWLVRMFLFFCVCSLFVYQFISWIVSLFFYGLLFSFYLLFIYLPLIYLFVCAPFEILIDLSTDLSMSLLLVNFFSYLMFLYWLFLPNLQNSVCEPHQI